MTNKDTEKILGVPLKRRQFQLAFTTAQADADHWLEEAKAGTLPDVDTMHLDWEIPIELAKLGVDAYGMQRLSFAIANENAASKRPPKNSPSRNRPIYDI